MSLQLNHHHHQQIYEALKNSQKYNIAYNPIIPLLKSSSTYKSKYQSPSQPLVSQMLHHYENQIVTSAIDRRRLQFRDFVAEKVRQSQLSKQIHTQHHNLQILGKIDRLRKQRLMLVNEKQSRQDSKSSYKTYGYSLDKQNKPYIIQKHPNSGGKYTKDHSLQFSKQIQRRSDGEDKTLYSQLLSKQLSKQKIEQQELALRQKQKIRIGGQKQKIVENNKIVQQISNKILNMHSYLSDKSHKLTQSKNNNHPQTANNESLQKENHHQFHNINPIHKYNSIGNKQIRLQDSIKADRNRFNKYSTNLNNPSTTHPNIKKQSQRIQQPYIYSNPEIEMQKTKLSKQYEWNQKLAQKIRSRWNVQAFGQQDGCIPTIPNNNISVFALQSSQLARNRSNSKLEYLQNYATLGNYTQLNKNIHLYQYEANKNREQLSVRNKMFDKYISNGGIKGLLVHDRILDRSMFSNYNSNNKNNLNTVDVTDGEKQEISINPIFNNNNNINSHLNNEKKKSILKNKNKNTNIIDNQVMHDVNEQYKNSNSYQQEKMGGKPNHSHNTNNKNNNKKRPKNSSKSATSSKSNNTNSNTKSKNKYNDSHSKKSTPRLHNNNKKLTLSPIQVSKKETIIDKIGSNQYKRLPISDRYNNTEEKSYPQTNTNPANYNTLDNNALKSVAINTRWQRIRQKNNNRRQIGSNKIVTFQNNENNDQGQLSYKKNQNLDRSTVDKIQRRVRLSMSVFEDSQYRNIMHEKNHLDNTYAVQKSLRQELIDKLCQTVRNNQIYKARRSKSLSRRKNNINFFL